MTLKRLNFNEVLRKNSNRAGLALILLMTLGLGLAACGNEPPPPAQVQVDLPGDATATPPFPARAATPTATVTSDAARVFNSPPPALFPTNTVPPIPKAPDFTATASVPDANLTPTAMPTGQLAYIQAGNLWVIDDTGSNRRQLTESADINSDGFLSWDLTNDKMVYVSRAGELWAVDLQGKRSLVFSPTRTAKLSASAKLPPLPTAIPATTGPTTQPVSTAPARNGPQVSSPVWSPDGRYVAFNFYAGESGLLASGEVWVADLLTDKVGLTRVGEGFGPTWGPDSRTLAYLSRGEVRNAPPRPTLDPSSPPGTSLLPPTRAGNAESLSEVEAQATPAPPPPSPTAFIIRPGATQGPTPSGSVSPTPVTTPTPLPTPTLNLVALPSPTPTPTYPPVFLGNFIANRLMVYSLTNKKASVLLESEKLPDAFVDTTNSLRSYVPAPLQAAWWSPDGRYIAIADRLSVVGVIAATGNTTPVVWTGLPQSFTVYDLEWLPRSDGVFLRYGYPYNETISQIMLLTFTGNGNAPGVSGDVTNRGLIKISVLPGGRASCPELTPGGNLFSYYDGAALVVTRPDGSIYSSYSDSQCPAWAPFGRNFATIRKNTDGAVVLSSLDLVQPRILISARAVERVFWLRSDPSYLGGQPNVPVPTPVTPRP